jgi:hypothetical protein
MSWGWLCQGKLDEDDVEGHIWKSMDMEIDVIRSEVGDLSLLTSFTQIWLAF